MTKQSVNIARYPEAIARLGLGTIAGARTFQGDLVKDHRGRRDIFQIRMPAGDGPPVVLFLKRNRVPYRKDGLTSLCRRGRVHSASRVEWENCLALQSAGIRTAPLVAFGEECGPLWERFSFIVTEAAPGEQTLEEFIRTCPDQARRRTVIHRLAKTVRRMHDAGLAAPDLFTRHIFLSWEKQEPEFCLIDMARLDRAQPVPVRLQARDLAALNITAPLRHVSLRERILFLRHYCGSSHRGLRVQIDRRVRYLLRKRSKFAGYTARV